MPVGLGGLWAVVAAFANGTFGVFSKARPVVENKVSSWIALSSLTGFADRDHIRSSSGPSDTWLNIGLLQVHPVVFNFWVALGVVISSAGFIFHDKFVSQQVAAHACTTCIVARLSSEIIVSISLIAGQLRRVVIFAGM